MSNHNKNGFLDGVQSPWPGSSGGRRPQSGVVIYYVMLCRQCGSDQVEVTRTASPIRFHKCRKCGHTFKSVEKKYC